MWPSPNRFTKSAPHGERPPQWALEVFAAFATGIPALAMLLALAIGKVFRNVHPRRD